MASAKKGKKNKGKTVPLQDFLQETAGTVPSMPIRKSTLNWADEVEDNHDVYESRSSKTNVILPTAPKASRDVDDINDKVPQEPPFIAYLSNLPYDVDETEISLFFKNMKITNMRIPKDDRPGEMPKLKGFGYVEFEDRDSLLNALVIPDTSIKNRRIRIEVATDYDNDKRRGGRMDMNRDRSGRSDNSMGDWRSGPRQESSSDGDRRPFSRDRDRDRDDNSSASSGAWRDGPRNNRDSDRDRDRDRGFTRSSYRDDRDRDRDHDYNRRGGEGRDRDDKSSFMSRRFDREDRDRGGGGRNGGGMDRGGGGGGGGFTRGPPPSREEQGGDGGRSEPKQRTKLVLAPRTKPVENEGGEKATSSIFGNAKPVDTSARERQIEERLAKDHDAPQRREVSRERREEKKDKEKAEEEEGEASSEETDKKSIEKEISPADNEDDGKYDENGDDDVSAPPPRKNAGEPHQKESVKVADAPPPPKQDNKKAERKDKEMPKMKKADPPNFIANNKFAFLETEDNSD